MYEGRNIKNTTARGYFPSEIYPLTVWVARPVARSEEAFDDAFRAASRGDRRDTQIVRGTIERKWWISRQLRFWAYIFA